MIKRKHLITISIAFAVALMLIPSTQASIGLPDYDSGWISINQGQEIHLTHNLGTTEVLVYLVGKISEDDVHQIQYGGDSTLSSGYQGGNWHGLSSTTIIVRRHANDDHWNYIRVMIWKIEPEPEVGGLYLTIDKFALLAPYIVLVSTIILAVSMSVAYIKYRKKQ